MIQKFIKVRPDRSVVDDGVVTSLVVIVVVPVMIKVRSLVASVDTSETHMVSNGDDKALGVLACAIPHLASLRPLAFAIAAFLGSVCALLLGRPAFTGDSLHSSQMQR